MDKVQLVKSCQAGDREAFGILYTYYYSRLRDVVAYYVHCDSAVKDILHDGFLIVFASIGSLNDGAKIEAWLTTIMKNLSLQYLKEESCRLSVPMPVAEISDTTKEDFEDADSLTWDELDRFINKLPGGYSKVFRLAVLDGLSHKEIGDMLGIAPHSSSSQLAHAKAMLRRLITEYRVEMGILSIVATILLVWNIVRSGDDSRTSTISKSAGGKTHGVVTSIKGVDANPDSIIPRETARHKTMPDCLMSVDTIAAELQPKDSVPTIEPDSVSVNTLWPSHNIQDRGKSIAREFAPRVARSGSSGWSLSLAYAGNAGHDGLDCYRMPSPGIPDVEGPSTEIEITENTHHHVPLVIGLSVNKSLSSRWSIGSGVRYTFLRSDILSQSECVSKETIQRIHYIGVPVKFSYRMFTHRDFSVYGHGGFALDIPVGGSQSVREYSPEFQDSKAGRYGIHAPLQWSAEGGVGVQYHFTPSFSIYVEPSFRYNFNVGSEIRTIRQEKPFEFTISIGLGYTW